MQVTLLKNQALFSHHTRSPKPFFRATPSRHDVALVARPNVRQPFRRPLSDIYTSDSDCDAMAEIPSTSDTRNPQTPPDVHGSASSAVDTTYNLLQAQFPGAGSHSGAASQWQQVTAQGCYLLHGPAKVFKVGPSQLYAQLGPGARLEMVGTGTTNEVPSQPGKPQRRHVTQHVVPAARQQPQQQQQKLDSHGKSDLFMEHGHYATWLPDTSSAAVVVDEDTVNICNMSFNDQPCSVGSGDFEQDPCCVLIGEHLALRGSYTLHYADQSTQSLESDDFTNTTITTPHTTTNSNSSSSHAGNSHMNVSYSSVGSLDVVYDEAHDWPQDGNMHVNNVATAGGMNGHCEGNSCHDGDKCHGLLHHGDMDVLSVHVMPAVVIELHDGCVMSHPLNMCPDSM